MDFNTPFDFAASANSREASDVRFMYFSSQEVRNISVVQIDDVALFDEWNEQVEGGLYAPQMGPMKMNKEKRGEKTFCKTCGLTMDCPGHMGHIEFATPVFNPFLMGSVQKLMARCCMKCKKLLCADAKTQNTVVQLQRLAPGDMAKTRGSKQKGAKKRTALESDLKGDEDEFRLKRTMVHAIHKERGDIIYEDRPMSGSSSYLEHEMAGDILYKEAEQIDARREQDEMERRARASSSSTSGTGQRCHIAACTQSLRAVLGEYCRDIPARCARCEQSGAKVTRLGFTALKLTRLKSEWKRDGGPEDGMLLPMTARSFLRELWENERDILWYLIPGARELEAEMFFLENILVPPNRFRPAEPPLMEGGAPRLDRQTSHFLNVVFANHEVRRLIKKNSRKQQGDDEEAASEEDDEEAEEKKKKAEKPQKGKGKGRGKGAAEKSSVRKMDSLEQAVEQLQTMVNSCMDSGKSGKHPKLAVPGVRQLLERKEGLFRMKMMGKRVNFAARSVISPDPNIETSEIGIPMMIAQELTYPEVAADHNIDLLRRLVERGAEYPGATEVHIPKASGGKVITKLRLLDPQRRMAIAKQLQMDMESGKPPMTVFRQLVDGDPLLVNRQPTLHKPGIMAHVAKVMRKEKTIRLHYVNCNTYNADFDGDEMNLHAPQDPIGRMEALGIARADKQYLVPTSGKPLRGLIQDHCIAGAMLSKRDSFFTRADVCFLLYTGLRAAVETGISTFDFGNKKKNKSSTRPFVYPSLQSYTQHLRLRLDEPTILKPRKLWSGKQVFTMLLKNLVELCGERKAPVGLYLESNSKTPGDIWNGKLDGDKEESSVLFQDMDFLRGVLDKAQFGASSYGLTHIIHELLGGNLVGMWFASLARMLTMLLQMRGFTCAFADLFLTDQTEETRRKLIKTSRVSAKGAVEGWLTKNEVPGFADGKATPHRISEAASDLLPKQKRAQEYEGAVIGKMKENWSDLINMCIPVGQKLTFPRNCFSAMVQTGAKGSKVNQSQVSCCLGQQELEGRLPPLMCTYRSLPCFAAFDMASRTRGYIADRFLSGIRPQEFFFHCMAGREGLVDTAVKTSRSGYLQRCLIKHLEGLKVSYDLTVRDSDGSVLQFLYGEDGADVTRASYLFNFKALQPNLKAVQANMEEYERTFGTVESRASPAFLAVRQACSQGKAKEAARLLKQMLNECPELDPASRHYLQTKLEDLRRGVIPDHIDPQSSILSPAHHFGSTSEKHEGELKKYLDGLRAKGAISEADAAALTKCMKMRFMQALAEPGEAVGVIAAQSMGEPSTQMTLNTFHLAGHGGANVTLGIPRLREIVQTASKTCSTPLMSVKVLCDETGNTSHDARMAYAQKMQSKFRHIKFMDCVQRLVVHEECKEQKNGEVWWVYHCRFFFFDINQIHKKVPHITAQRLQSFMTRCIVRKLKNQITRVMNAAKAAAAAHKQSKAGDEGEQVGLGDDAGGEDAGGSKDSKVAPKKKARYMARGAEDREGIEEANVNADEAEAENADGPDNGDDESEASGMYEDKDDEDIAFEGNADPEEAVADPAEDEAGEAAPHGRPDGDEAMGVGKPKGKAKTASSKPGSSSRPPAPAEDSEEEDEEEDVAEAGDDESFVDSDEDSSDESSNEDAPEGGKGMAGEKRKKGTKQVDTNAGLRDSRAQQDLEAAWESSAMAYSGPLENNEMCVIVRHRHSECPHSVYVGEVLHKLCSRGQLQDPSCKGVKKVHVKQERGEVFLECEGINLYSLQLLGDTVDHQRVYTNDIQRVLRKFGVEAARAAVVREIRNVFGHYGIDVDHRHLSLIADYMGQGGGLRAFNRGGMTQSASPIQQMSFETTMQFMTAACQDGLPDSVDSPASSIVLGQLPKVGTGMVEVLVDLTPKDPKWRKRREFTFDG